MIVHAEDVAVTHPAPTRTAHAKRQAGRFEDFWVCPSFDGMSPQRQTLSSPRHFFANETPILLTGQPNSTLSMLRCRLHPSNTPSFIPREYQTTGCPQVISAEEASARAKNDSIPGNIINLSSEGEGGGYSIPHIGQISCSVGDLCRL